MGPKPGSMPVLQWGWRNCRLRFRSRSKLRSRLARNSFRRALDRTASTGAGGPIHLRNNGYTQIFTDKQYHIICPAGIPDGATLPPPLPDVLSSQAQVKLSARRRIVAIA